MKYFSKKKYTIELVDKSGYERWKLKNPEYSNIDYSTYLKYWKYIRQGFVEEILRNPFGINLPFYLGNVSIKKMDREFKCEKDYPITPVYNKELDKMEAKPYPNFDNKVVRIYWKKIRRFMIPSLFGVEFKSAFTKDVSKRLRTMNLNVFQMEPHSFTYPSKCGEKEDKKPFDLV
jgi:hypothetical protein